MTKVPLSFAGSAEAFGKRLEAHRSALESHRKGKHGRPAPLEHEIVDALILRVPDSGPVATRGPDKFVIAPYEIFDDKAAEAEQKRAAAAAHAEARAKHERSLAAIREKIEAETRAASTKALAVLRETISG